MSDTQPLTAGRLALLAGLAALGTALIGAVPAAPTQTFGWVMLAGTAGAAMLFRRVAAG